MNEKLIKKPIPDQIMMFLIHLYQRFRRNQNRSFGIWRLIVVLARMKKEFRRFQLVGPDFKPFFVDLSDVGSLAYLAHGDLTSFEDLEKKIAIQTLSNDSVILDIGANIGVWSRTLAAYCKSGIIYAFEPSKTTYDLLQFNTSGYSNIMPVNLALGETEGVLGLSGGPSVFRHLADQNNGKNEIVNVITLDQWAEKVNLDKLNFIKMDVEGSEAKVFLGAFQTLKKFHPIILFEQAPQLSAEFCDAGLDKCVNILNDLGYSVMRILKDGTLSEELEYSPITSSSMWAIAKTGRI
jgi:FkbM family methyltransferase